MYIKNTHTKNNDYDDDDMETLGGHFYLCQIKWKLHKEDKKNANNNNKMKMK